MLANLLETRVPQRLLDHLLNAGYEELLTLYVETPLLQNIPFLTHIVVGVYFRDNHLNTLLQS